MMLIPSLNEKKVLECLSKNNNGLLYQKCGYIFEELKEEFRFSDAFFEECEAHSSGAKRYLMKELQNNVYCERWKLYVSPSLKGLIDKGVESEVAVNPIDAKKHEELVHILSELVETIALMKKEEYSYLLFQNEREANDWLIFLREHTDKEELKSLENEIADRFFYRYDVRIGKTNLDKKRTELIKRYLFKSNEYLG